MGGEDTKEARAEWQRLQEDLLGLQEEYSRLRLESWRREIRGMAEGWESFQREWRSSLEFMEDLAAGSFGAISAKGEAASQMLAAGWRQSLAAMAVEVEEWGEHVLGVLERLNQAWQGLLGGEAGGWLSWLGFDGGFAGLFHQGGVVDAHQGMVVGAETLLSDERLVKVQTGEGILPREVMVALGEENFEALRQGRFGMQASPGSATPGITIQVQALDTGGVAALDWDRLVQRHILPALRQEAERRW
jgi:hypothetical protein